MAFNLDFKYMRGDTFNVKKLKFNLPDINEFNFTVQRRISDAKPVYLATIENGKIEKENNFEFKILNFNLDFPVGTYYYNIEIRYNNRVRTIFVGKIVLTQDVTYAR